MARKRTNQALKPKVRLASLSTLPIFGSAEALSGAAASRRRREEHTPGPANWDKIEAEIFGPKK